MIKTSRKIIELVNNSKKDKYKILTFPTHERYETELCKTGHDFYSFSLGNGQSKKWNTEQLPIPENYHILPENAVVSISYDFILVQSKYWQYQIAQQINNDLHIPVIVLEHTLPTPNIPKNSIELMRTMVGDINIFISEYSMRQWRINTNATVIYHGIDSDIFKPIDTQKEEHILTVANDFVNRDYCLNYSGWKRITNGLKTKLVGDTMGLSVPASSTHELVMEYNKCQIYLNTSTLSPIPTSLLEAMSCGCAVVSTATCMIPEVIKNGVNGFISNNEDELRNYIDILSKDAGLRNKLGMQAQQTIKDMFPCDQFIKKWNKVFDTIYEVSRR